MSNRFRDIPQLDRLLRRPDLLDLAGRVGRSYVAELGRKTLARVKTRLASDESARVEALLEPELEAALEEARLRPLQRVINATGVVLHTNLGRAPFGRALLEEALSELSGACSLEIDLASGQRGVRADFVCESAARLCGAQSGLVVNNNAAAVLLTLSALAQGREVVVSRGELVQIGGGFRIPDVIRQGGALLTEVGTTNITTLEDYRRAIGDNTAALLKVHPSNFTQQGFSKRPTIQDLAALKRPDLPLIEDLGSGCLLDHHIGRMLSDATPAQSLAAGADLVCFSGDKLLGGPQAGLIVGRRDLIDRLAKHPLMRALRPDKLTYALLQVVFRHYENGHPDAMAPWRQLAQSRETLSNRCVAFRDALGLSPEAYPVVETDGEFGAGSLPGETIPSAALVLSTDNPDENAGRLRCGKPPVVGVIRNGCLMLDFLSVDPEEEGLLAEALRAFLRDV